MSIKFECPHCQRKLKVPDELAGKKCRCVSCKQGFVVPAATAPVDGVVPPPPAARPISSPSPPPQPASAPPDATLPVPPRPTPARSPVAAKGQNGAANSASPQVKLPPPPRKPPVQTPAPAAPDHSPEDIEALAAAAFADKPPEPEVVVNESIKFECEYCGFALEVSADLGGKRTQCSDCRRITRVPEVVKREAKEWHRAAQTKAEETAAEASREGAWGTANIKATDQKALVEAGLLPDDTPPLTRTQTIVWWSVRGVAGAAALGLIVFGVLQIMSWWGGRKQERMFKETFTFATDDKVPSEGVAVLHIAAGDLRRRQARPRDGSKRGSAAEARNQFTEAYKLLAVSTDPDRDLALTRLALSEIELGGQGDDVTLDTREKWDDVQRSLITTLSAITSWEARAIALRATCRRLLALKQGKRVLPLTMQVTDPAGVEPVERAHRAEIFAQVGLDLLSRDRPLAEQLAGHLGAFGDPPPTEPSVVALLTAVGSTAPAPPVAFVVPPDKAKLNKDQLTQAEAHAAREYDNVSIGEVEALARRGRVDEARRRAETLGEIARLQALVAIAEAVHDVNPADRAHVDAACQFAGTMVDRRGLDWTLMRLLDLAVAVGVEQDRLANLTAMISPELRGRAQYVVFHAKAADSKGAITKADADAVNATYLAHGLALLELARVNTRKSSGYADEVATWGNLRSYGMIGALLGLQGGEP